MVVHSLEVIFHTEVFCSLAISERFESERYVVKISACY
jgi:hypothetical protein